LLSIALKIALNVERVEKLGKKRSVLSAEEKRKREE